MLVGTAGYVSPDLCRHSVTRYVEPVLAHHDPRQVAIPRVLLTTFPTELSRHQLALTTSTDTGLAVLLGPVASIDTVGGYTVYKGFVFLTTIGAIWAVLAANRLLRGEEDSGRWQVMLAGSTRASRATAATMGALAAAIGVMFAGTMLIMLLAGRNPDVGFGWRDSLFYGLSIAIPPTVFAALGALTSQLSRTRRAANSLGLTIFGVIFAIRMIADSGPSTRWLLWATPFGWTERMRPLTDNDLWPLVPAGAAVLVLGAAAIVLASKRDTGDGVLASRDVVPLRPFGLRSAFGMTARLELPVLVAWCVWRPLRA
jgi:ABC-2 type transport system permease protein